MILPTCGINKPIKRKIFDIDNDETTDTDDEDEISETETATDNEIDVIDTAQTSIEDDLINTWEFLSPPSKEEDIIEEKWFAVIYAKKRTQHLFVAKANHRFLVDEGGQVDTVLLTCLKPKIGSGNILEETPKHLPHDQDMFNLSDVIYGSIEAIQYGSDKFNIPKYDYVKTVNRVKMLQKM